jgi:hypothetical protein
MNARPNNIAHRASFADAIADVRTGALPQLVTKVVSRRRIDESRALIGQRWPSFGKSQLVKSNRSVRGDGG